MLLKRQIILEKCSPNCLFFRLNKCKIQYIREQDFGSAGRIRAVELELFNQIVNGINIHYDYYIQSFIIAENLNLLYKNEGQTKINTTRRT